MHRRNRIIVCRCEDISLDQIEELIELGYTELGDIKRLLRCGMGACQGRTCMKLIAQIIARNTGKQISDIRFPTARVPLKPVPLVALSTFERNNKWQE